MILPVSATNIYNNYYGCIVNLYLFLLVLVVFLFVQILYYMLLLIIHVCMAIGKSSLMPE